MQSRQLALPHESKQSMQRVRRGGSGHTGADSSSALGGGACYCTAVQLTRQAKLVDHKRARAGQHLQPGQAGVVRVVQAVRGSHCGRQALHMWQPASQHKTPGGQSNKSNRSPLGICPLGRRCTRKTAPPETGQSSHSLHLGGAQGAGGQWGSGLGACTGQP